MIDIKVIVDTLPHRYPFLLVDRIIHIGKDEIVGIKNVTINEPFFQGHFPGEPVMPGVLVLESMGQVAAMMILNEKKDTPILVYLTGIERAKFRKPVVPGDVLKTKAKIIKIKGNFGKVEAVATVDDEVAAEAVFSFAVVERR